MNSHVTARRLATIESLCRYARAGVVLKRGDSSKLGRAEEDLDAAIAALADMRKTLLQDDPAPEIDMIAELGAMSEANYMKRARRG